MACKCNKCDPQKACGCTDSALTTPCSYTDCSVGSERCADVQCAECVSYCGTSFEIEGENGYILRIQTGDRFDSIVQKFALILATGFGTCTADNLHHAPYNVFATSITSNSAVIQWNGVSTLSTNVQVFDATTTTAISGDLTPTTLSYTMTGLTPSTSYKVMIRSEETGTGATCDSVVIYFDTLAA